MNKPPLSFAALAKTARNPSSGGYPYTLKGEDLDKNFVFAVSQYEEADFEITGIPGSGGHQTRKIALKNTIPTPPASGTHVLGAVNGALTWLATEEC